MTPGPAAETVTSTRPHRPGSLRPDGRCRARHRYADGGRWRGSLSGADHRATGRTEGEGRDGGPDCGGVHAHQEGTGPDHGPVSRACRGHGAFPGDGKRPPARHIGRDGRRLGRAGHRRRRVKPQPLGAVQPGHRRNGGFRRRNVPDRRVEVRRADRRDTRERLRRPAGADRNGHVRVVRRAVPVERRYEPLRLPQREARYAPGEHASTRRGEHGTERDCRPDRAGAADPSPGLEGRGTDYRSVHPGGEGPTGCDGGNAGGVAVPSLRDGPGRRDPPKLS